MEDSTIAGLILIIIGGLEALKTDWLIRFQIWAQKKIMDADYIPGPRTYKTIRVIGTAFMVMGLFVLLKGK